MSTQTTARERPRWSWTTRELLLGAAVSVGTGVALIPVLFAYIAAVAAGPFGYAALAGLFSIPPILTMLLVRRPGAVLFGALISASVLAPFSGGGWVYPLGAVIFPLPVEAVFAVTRYRRFGPVIVLVAVPIAYLIPNFAVPFVPLGFADLAVGALIGALGLLLVSQVASAALALAMARALERTGVVRHRATGPAGVASSPAPVEPPEVADGATGPAPQ